LYLKNLTFKNSDSDTDTEAGHTRSGRGFREVHIANLFKKNYDNEGFYSGEKVDLTDEEHSEPKNVGKIQKLQELRRLLSKYYYPSY
jgi:hypothetical protein